MLVQSECSFVTTSHVKRAIFSVVDLDHGLFCSFKVRNRVSAIMGHISVRHSEAKRRTGLSHELGGKTKLAMRAQNGEGSDVAVAFWFLVLWGILFVVTAIKGIATSAQNSFTSVHDAFVMHQKVLGAEKTRTFCKAHNRRFGR